MFDRTDHTIPANEEAMEGYINNPLWGIFCEFIKEKYNCGPVFEFSKCGMEYGWNAKFKKSGKSLCTVYPREGFFTVMIVIGRREKERFEQELSSYCMEIQRIYEETKEGNGQKWLMIDLEDEDEKYENVKKMLGIRVSAA